MANAFKRDVFKYKQQPYFEKPDKQVRKTLARSFRHYIKQEVDKTIKRIHYIKE